MRTPRRRSRAASRSQAASGRPALGRAERRPQRPIYRWQWILTSIYIPVMLHFGDMPLEHAVDIPSLPVAVIGAGPVGLAAAAELVKRGVTPLIFEAGAT